MWMAVVDLASAAVAHHAADRRRALARALHADDPISAQLVRLREQVAAYRAQAIALDAKFRRAGGDWGEIREQLLDSSARIDRAVRGIVDARRTR